MSVSEPNIYSDHNHPDKSIVAVHVETADGKSRNVLVAVQSSKDIDGEVKRHIPDCVVVDWREVGTIQKGILQGDWDTYDLQDCEKFY